jgi:hypothetical protein
MSKIVRAEAALTLEGECPSDAVAAAKAAGALAAHKTPELIPYCQGLHPIKTDIDIAVETGEIRISAAVEVEIGGEAQALTASFVAAVTLVEMTGASLQSVKLAAKEASAPKPYARKVPATRVIKTAAAPTTLVGLISAPKPAEGKADKREAFRTFMTVRHLRISEWAKQAGVPAAIVYAFLTGRTNMLASDVADKLAAAANVRTEDLFR